MERDKNFFSRAFAAMIAGRERQAQRYVAQFERDYGAQRNSLNKR